MRVTQSKPFNNNETCCNAEHAVDKDLSSGAAAVVVNDKVWLKLEFDKTYFISKLVIYFMFYTNWFGGADYWHESEDRFRAGVDLHNNVDVSVYKEEVKKKTCGTLRLTYGLEQSDQIYTMNCKAQGDTVKFSKTLDRILVYEITVLTGSYSYLANHQSITDHESDYHARNYFNSRNQGNSDIQKHKSDVI